MHRDHLIRALVPLYLGRAAGFLAANNACEAASVEERLEALGLGFEEGKPRFVRRWTVEEGS